MYTFRRWWSTNGLRLGLMVAALSLTWVVRQTNGLPVLELYRWIQQAFQGIPSNAEVLETARIQELQSQLQEVQQQNQQLRSLVDYPALDGQQTILSPVIGRSTDQWWHQILLGHGSRDGIEVGDVVAGTGGLVGRVSHVTPSTSRVLLLSDPASQVGATVSRSRAMGYLRGQAGNLATLVLFDKVPDIKPGDAVTTSHLSHLFPAGISIGTVRSIDLDKSPAPEALIELTAPISRLEWVVVHPNPKRATAELSGGEE
ncbi:MAG: rod shape-determining protein MreC [Cyanobacteria bacterium P01_A01_bin.135]